MILDFQEMGKVLLLALPLPTVDGCLDFVSDWEGVFRRTSKKSFYAHGLCIHERMS